MATGNPCSCFLENRDGTERLLFWFERFPTILVPLVFFFSPAEFVFTYLICIPILVLTNSTYLLCFSIREDITDDEASHHDDQETSLKEEVELLAFALERIGVVMLFFSCSNDPLGAPKTFILIAFVTTFFIFANLVYFGFALCRMFEINPQESRKCKQKEVASEEKKFGLPENVMDANGGENTLTGKTDQLSIGTILEYWIQKLEEYCSEINKDDDDIPDLVEVEDSEANELPRLEEDVDAAEDERKGRLFPDSEAKNTNSRETAEDNFEILNTQCDEYTKKDSEANELPRLEEDVDAAEDERKGRLFPDSEAKNTNSRETAEDNFEILNTQCDEYTKKLVEAMEESYRNKLKKKKNHWEKHLKQVVEIYEEDRQKWEKEKQNLVSQLCAATAQYEFYHTLYCNHEEEKNDLITKLSFATASCELYKNLLHDLFSSSE